MTNNKTKKCKCGRIMILRGSNRVLLSDPPQYPQQWWCGGCGRVEEGPIIRGTNFEESVMEEWRQANGM